jgi:alpha-glucosidase
MVGSDVRCLVRIFCNIVDLHLQVCGFKLEPSEKLCARWTTLGAFSPFFRNHAHDEAPPQEFYLSPLVTSAAKYAISMRYRLLDYIYSALQAQSTDGTPAINPLWYIYPRDPNTYPIDLQYFYGNCILVSPVTEVDSTDVSIYLPDDIFYDLETLQPVRGHAQYLELTNVAFDRIPLHIRGGCIVPMRVRGANTTTELRKLPFELLVAPSLEGTASGSLWVDDGISIEDDNALDLRFTYADGKLKTSVTRGPASPADAGVHFAQIKVLGGQHHGSNTGFEREEL